MPSRILVEKGGMGAGPRPSPSGIFPLFSSSSCSSSSTSFGHPHAHAREWVDVSDPPPPPCLPDRRLPLPGQFRRPLYITPTPPVAGPGLPRARYVRMYKAARGEREGSAIRSPAWEKSYGLMQALVNSVRCVRGRCLAPRWRGRGWRAGFTRTAPRSPA